MAGTPVAGIAAASEAEAGLCWAGPPAGALAGKAVETGAGEQPVPDGAGELVGVLALAAAQTEAGFGKPSDAGAGLPAPESWPGAPGPVSEPALLLP